MPAYRFLARTPLQTDDLGLHLAALRKVGVPYTDDMIENAAKDAQGQATPGSEFSAGVVKRYGDKTQVSAFDGVTTQLTEMDALVAYLQVLGRLTDAAYKQTAGSTKTPDSQQ
jgi:cytochrome c oxidase cbb3-type subunit 2